MSTFLVEDDPKIRAALVPLIEASCKQPYSGFAETEADALTWIENHSNWKLLVLDVMLREGSGLGILQKMQSRKPGQAVVMLTNSATPQLRDQAARLGADAVFDKTAELTEFLDYCAVH